MTGDPIAVTEKGEPIYQMPEGFLCQDCFEAFLSHKRRHDETCPNCGSNKIGML